MLRQLRVFTTLIISLYMTSDFLGESVEMAYKCQNCDYVSNWSSNLRRHEKAKHNGENGLSSPMANNKHFGSGYNVDNISGVFDIRLKENFKLFVTGPSRCGKTVFVAKLLENIHAFSKLPTVNISYTATCSSIHTTKDYTPITLPSVNATYTTICNIIHANRVNTKYTTTCCYQFTTISSTI